jgi:hypothetical protein
MAGDGLMNLPARNRAALVKQTISYRSKITNLRSCEPILFDNCQEWEVLPHKSGPNNPTGITTLFTDGHVSFCRSKQLFSSEGNNKCWPKNFRAYFDGPGNNIACFLRIVKELKNIQ